MNGGRQDGVVDATNRWSDLPGVVVLIMEERWKKTGREKKREGKRACHDDRWLGWFVVVALHNEGVRIVRQ